MHFQSDAAKACFIFPSTPSCHVNVSLLLVGHIGDTVACIPEQGGRNTGGERHDI